MHATAVSAFLADWAGEIFKTPLRRRPSKALKSVVGVDRPRQVFLVASRMAGGNIMATELIDPMASVRVYLEAEKSANTRRAYASDWKHFFEWCGRVCEEALPSRPLAVAQYLAQLADGGLKTASIERRVAAIRYFHKAAGHEPPTNAEGVKAVMRGIRRTKGKRQVRKAPARARLLEEAIAALPATLAGLRDRALLLIGFAAALRRSELVALQVVDVRYASKGIFLNVGKSKTDQEGRGTEIPIPRGGKLKPVQALEAWLKAASVTEGPIFREVDRHGRVGAAALSDRSVARVVKRCFARIGAKVEDFAGHSLRAGFVTEALANRVDPLRITTISRHAKLDTLKIYDRRENDFDDHAGEGFL